MGRNAETLRKSETQIVVILDWESGCQDLCSQAGVAPSLPTPFVTPLVQFFSSAAAAPPSPRAHTTLPQSILPRTRLHQLTSRTTRARQSDKPRRSKFSMQYRFDAQHLLLLLYTMLRSAQACFLNPVFDNPVLV